MARRAERSDNLGAFGPNAWLVDEMYEDYLRDPSSVSESWQDFFADYRGGKAPQTEPRRAPENGPPAAPAEVARRPPEVTPPSGIPPGDEVAALRGAAARAVSNMEASLGVPTATSVRQIPAKLLEINRTVLNNYLSRHSRAKVSFTHVIGFAVVRAMGAVPAMKSAFVPDSGGGTPGVVRHAHVGLGLAVDVERSDGTRTLLVPCIRDADTLDFRSFLLGYEDLVRKVRANRVTADDFSGTTATLTNPGTLGTVHSVPRLMSGQGVIVGVGALNYPAEYQAADPAVLARIGLSKVITLTSTYDHRVIQGAESGLFLAEVHDLLLGKDGFYDEVFRSMGVPYEPVRWRLDINPVDDGDRGQLSKAVHVQTLINMYRVRGHLIADLDPLELREPHLHPELDPVTYGLTLWDLEREFFTDGLAGRDMMPLADILGILRDAYSRTVGVEYMHIQDPVQKRWIQRMVEGVSTDLPVEEQRHILGRLNAAEAFERFLHTRYIGQKRFGLEGAESAIPLLDAVLDEAASAGMEEVVIGMAHRGRLNVLANIVGQSYEEIFREFEDEVDPESVEGTGDVKYHKGASGKFVGRAGLEVPVTMASNPSHLEAVDPVVEGMVRGRQDVLDRGDEFPVLPVLVHGDAAFAGQGVVAETLNLSELRGYRTGGTVHLVINNQLGFTTAAESARSSVYPTDVAKMVQAPIFHVNGDDPEACVRVGRMAFAFRQAFNKDVVIDMVCYRLHGHNETDEPSYTQPRMYHRIENKRSVRKLYTETLVNRGDLTLDEAEQALEDFSKRLQLALDATRSNAPPRLTQLPPPKPPAEPLPSVGTGVERAVLDQVCSALDDVPAGFHLHPKLGRQLESRRRLYESGEVDWSLAEALAIGSLLRDGTDVRLTGQDTRRGTFSQRHAALVDYDTGAEHLPLADVGGQGGGRFFAYDSLLSEYAALGYEYGYSVVREDALVAFEAQFGDFINGAQVVVDQFIVAAEDKWGQSSGIVLLLPHGYEGQGPEHSSARLERFLAASADGNICVVQPTTASQYFHILRAQAVRSSRRPLVVMTPKSLLRSRSSRSAVADLDHGGFEEVLDDPETSGRDAPGVERDGVRRVVLCSGKVAFDAMQRRNRLLSEGKDPRVAIVRLEQLYPFPARRVEEVIGGYGGAIEIAWLQEEPENMGAWSFVHARLHRVLRDDYTLTHVSREESGGTATGSFSIHQLEADDLLNRAIG